MKPTDLIYCTRQHVNTWININSLTDKSSLSTQEQLSIWMCLQLFNHCDLSIFCSKDKKKTQIRRISHQQYDTLLVSLWFLLSDNVKNSKNRRAAFPQNKYPCSCIFLLLAVWPSLFVCHMFRLNGCALQHVVTEIWFAYIYPPYVQWQSRRHEQTWFIFKTSQILLCLKALSFFLKMKRLDKEESIQRTLLNPVRYLDIVWAGYF